MIDHRRIDERSLAFDRAIAERLAAQPEWIVRARATLSRWMTTCSPQNLSSLKEWQAALDGTPQDVILLLTGTDERATRLRQSNPFAGVLSPRERNSILRRFQSHDAPTA